VTNVEFAEDGRLVVCCLMKPSLQTEKGDRLARNEGLESMGYWLAVDELKWFAALARSPITAVVFKDFSPDLN